MYYVWTFVSQQDLVWWHSECVKIWDLNINGQGHDMDICGKNVIFDPKKPKNVNVKVQEHMVTK